MATPTLPSILSLHPLSHQWPNHSPRFLSFALSSSPLFPRLTIARKLRTLTLASNSSTSREDYHDDGFHLDDLVSNSAYQSPPTSLKKSVLADLILEIEPLDVSLIQKDVPPTTLDAMKRTISGMLGLLPSDRFQILIEALWEPLSKLLVSSMMTGYTLWNAEYRLCLERNLDRSEEFSENQVPENSNFGLQETSLDDTNHSDDPRINGLFSKFKKVTEDFPNKIDIKSLGSISPEAQEYILQMQSHLSSLKKELREVKRKNAALHMQQFVGEEKNDLLDYLRSLKPEKVAELSEPTSPEVKDTIYSVVHGLLATLSPKMHSTAPPSENPSNGAVKSNGEDQAELIQNTSLQFQPLITLTRDYLARLLFWCMLLGHHLRGLEYRMELMELLSLTSDAENGSRG